MPGGEEAERAAERFYEGVLGLRKVPKPPAMAARGGCWFEGPAVHLHLGVEDDFRPARKAHPAILVDDLDVACARVVEAGGEVRSADGLPGVARVHTDDPFGNRLELVQAVGPPAEAFATMADHSIFPLALVDNTGAIAWVGESIDRFFGWRPEQLIGESFERVIAPESLPAVLDAFTAIDEAFEATPWGGVGFPADLLRGDGTVETCELSVLTTRRSGLPWYVVTIRRVGYERALDAAVAAMAEGSSLADILERLVDALQEMVPDSRVGIGDRWTGDRFAVVAGSPAALLAVEGDTPWQRALAAGEDVWIGDLDGLPPPLEALAEAEGYQACWVHPVVAPGDARPSAAVVVWRTRPGVPTRFTWTTIDRVGQLLQLTLQWHRSHHTLQYAATHDQLTGLANRHAFLDRLDTVAPARRPRRGAVPRPRPLQAGQRAARPPGRRPGAGHRGRAARRGAPARRPGGSHRRRRVRGAVRAAVGGRRRRDRGQAVARRPAGAHPSAAGRPHRGARRRQHRHHRPRPDRRRRGHPGAGRSGDARSQGVGPRPLDPPPRHADAPLPESGYLSSVFARTAGGLAVVDAVVAGRERTGELLGRRFVGLACLGREQVG